MAQACCSQRFPFSCVTAALLLMLQCCASPQLRPALGCVQMPPPQRNGSHAAPAAANGGGGPGASPFGADEGLRYPGGYEVGQHALPC